MDGRTFPSFQSLSEGREEISEVKDCLRINPSMTPRDGERRENDAEGKPQMAGIRIYQHKSIITCKSMITLGERAISVP